MSSKIPAATATKARLTAIALYKIREENRIARKHLPALKEFFKQQQEQVLLRFVALKPLFDEQSAVKTNKAAPKVTQAAIKQFNEVWKGIEADTTEDLQDAILNFEQDGVKAGGDLMAKTINPTGKFWNLSNPRAVAYFRKTGGSLSYIKDIQDTTRASLQTTITQGLDEGWSYNDTAKEIQKLYDGPISTTRAKLIAVTETCSAYEAGNHGFAASLEDDGVKMEKRWGTSGDEKVCDLCQQNEDEGWIPIDQPHASGHQYPPGHPGDRCYEEYRQAEASD